MSEILSKERLRGIETWYRYGNTDQAGVINALIASHRALQAERDALKDDLATILKERNDFEIRCDALKAELIAWKHSAANEDCLREEINALKAELAEAKEERDKAVESTRWLRSYTDDCKKLIAEGREIIEGLKGFFPELMHLEKVKRFLKLSKEAQP